METAALTLIILSAVTGGWGDQQMKILTGRDVTFNAKLVDNYTEVNWFRGRRKIVDLEEGKLPYFYTLQDRVTADFKEATLTLRSVTPADSAEYKAELVVRGQLSPVLFHLQVFDHVCSAAILNTTEGHNVSLSCTCLSDGARPSTYRWYNDSDRSVIDRQNITAEKGKEPRSYTCTVTNEVSSNNATYWVPALPAERGPSAGIRIIIILICVIILTVFGSVCFYKNSKEFHDMVVRILVCFRCRNEVMDREADRMEKDQQAGEKKVLMGDNKTEAMDHEADRKENHQQPEEMKVLMEDNKTEAMDHEADRKENHQQPDS